MHQDLLKMHETKFLKNIKKFVNAYELLISNNCKKEAYNYVLYFYASFLGFLDKIYANDKIKNEIILNTLSIDLGIIYDLKKYVYSERKNDDINDIIYCYDRAYATQYKNIEYVLNYFLKIHKRIAIISNINNDEKVNIKKVKKLICK